MPGDHYYDRDGQQDLGPASMAVDLLKRARAAADEAKTLLRDVQITSGAGGAHTPKAVELLTAAVTEVDAAIALQAKR
jgi:hypothetical protein